MAMPTFKLPRSAPEAQGVSSQDVLAFIESVNRDIAYLHSFMLLRHGQVVAEGWWSPYTPDAAAHALFAEQEFHLNARSAWRWPKACSGG